MKKITALKYYLSSIPTLITGMNFWIIPQIFYKRPQLIKLKNGLKFFVNNFMDVWVLKEIILDEQYFKFSEIKDNWVIIDIGGAFGDFTIASSRKAKKVYSFEADKNIYNLLKKNLSLNNCKNIAAYYEKVKSLEEIFKKYKISRCDLLKIDCEGCEYKIFEKVSKNTLHKIDRIVMEMHLFDRRMEKSYHQLKIILKKNSFILKEVDNPVHEYLKFLFASKVS